MRAARWLSLTLALALTEAQGDFLMPGVRVVQLRPKRQGSAIMFPDSPFDPRPLPPSAPARPGFGDPEEGPDDVLEAPEDMDLNALDLNSLSLINSIDNITDFAKLFGIELPASADAFTRSDSPASRLGNSRAATELATMAKCKPELRTVPLDLPLEANTYFYPTCVRLEQCGGCCMGHLLTCRPKVTKVVKLKVLKTVAGRSSSSSSNAARSRGRRQRGRGRRRRRESVPSFHEVEAIKHVQCECGCKVQEQDCDPAIHTYLQRECSCACKSKDEKAKCERQSDTRYWDDNSCACYCRRPVDCSSGEGFSQASCTCERVTARGSFLVGIMEDFNDRRRISVRPLDRRPVRVPLRADEPVSSRRSTLVATSLVF